MRLQHTSVLVSIVGLWEASASGCHDPVVFMQHSVTGTVSRSQPSTSSHTRTATPASLLALGSSWYETGSDDELLLRKLDDRVRANEEREQEEAALHQASQTSGATFLDHKAAQVSLRPEEKNSSTQWLTQADITHWADDESKLVDMGSELQRIAAQVVSIAQHQKEFGMHLGLPDPTVNKFEVDDRVELRIGSGTNVGRWVKAVITGLGDRPNTYNVHVPSAKIENQDMTNVPAVALRVDEEEFGFAKEARDPALMTYEVGEQAQVKIAVGPAAGNWVRCKIMAKGTSPDTYDVYVKSAPAHHRDLEGIPAKALRKAESRGLFSQYDTDGDGVLSSQEFNIAVKEKATNVRTDTRSDERALFASGESAQVLSEDGTPNGTWVNCTIMGDGDLANSYNVFVASFTVGFQYEVNVPIEKLRKVGANKDAFDQKINLIPPQVDHEVLAPRGIYKGRWVPCQIRRKGEGDTSNVWMPFGVVKGHNLLANIPPDQLRIRKTCGPGYDDIFDGDSPGGDAFGRIYNRKNTVEDCAADCNRRDECRSFEWSPTRKECNLNQVLNPTLPAHDDQLFCRRQEITHKPAALWEGPLIGQELEYLMTVGNHNGEWHSGTVTAFGSKPDTYNINASISFLGGGFVNLTDVPVKYLRYSEEKPVQSLAYNWVPPQGEEAIYKPGNATLNATKVKDSKKVEDEVGGETQEFLVDNSLLKDLGPGLSYRMRKSLNSTAGAGAFASWGSYVRGVDVGDGWVKVGGSFLPTVVDGLPVLLPKIRGETGELVQVQKEDGVWAAATIRSRGDVNDTFNVKLQEGLAGRFMDNVPLPQLRKEVSAPALAAAPQSLQDKAPVLETLAPEALEPAAAAAPTEASSTLSTTPAVPADIAAPEPSGPPATANAQDFSHFISQNKKKVKETVDQVEQAIAIAKQRREYVVDNSRLHHKGPGLAYRYSKNLEDQKGRGDFALWGTDVTGVLEGDWLRVEGKFLPVTVKGVPVILPKVKGEFGEDVQVQTEDGAWAHATIRGRGDWPNTFHVHVLDNSFGYNLDNVGVRRLRKEPEIQSELAAEDAASAARQLNSSTDATDTEMELQVEDLGEDLPDGTFRVNMTAEVKLSAGLQRRAWVKCRVIELGEIADTYNLYVPSAPSGHQQMRNIPALAMRRLKRVQAAVSEKENTTIEVNGIDGDVNESVEVFVRKGPKAGEWVPAVIIGTGDVADSFNIRLPGFRGTHKDVMSVPGSMLRKSRMKVEIVQEPDFPKFEAGETAEVDVPVTDNTSVTYNCTVIRSGEFSNTYDIEVPNYGPYQGVHARFMRKIVEPVAAEVEEPPEQAPIEEPSVFTLKNVMDAVETVRADLTPLFQWLVDAKKEIKVWQLRAEDWSEGCSARDRVKFATKLRELGEASNDELVSQFPGQCAIRRWAQPGGISWEDIALCFQSASDTSRSCSNCPVKFLMTAAEQCLGKCQPMINSCKTEEQGSRTCSVASGRCLDCLEGPANVLMKCVNFRDQDLVSSALTQMVRTAKSGLLDAEIVLRSYLDPTSFKQADSLAKAGLHIFLNSWKSVMGVAGP